MQFILYKTVDGNNVINKTLTDSQTININLKRTANIYSPEIDLLNSELDYRSYNYCEIVELRRKYFISNFEIVNSRITRLFLRCDVLETFKSSILSSQARYLRAIKSGDYGKFPLPESHVKTISKHDSNVTIGEDKVMILSTFGG